MAEVWMALTFRQDSLVLSGFGDEIPETPISYDNCHFNNDLAKAIAAMNV